MGKCFSLRTARKLPVVIDGTRNGMINSTRRPIWAEGHPFQRCFPCEGNCAGKSRVEAKQRNSAIRKCVRVQLIKNGKRSQLLYPVMGCLKFTEENDEILIGGFGRKGHAVGDIPGV
ncbi:40S ribosomal protein S23 [Tupaia chinensis]|uniref:Small ribosomal subunit protein uS12 n=1 Tax=Tupaia chinensis TaxID=246437 RepID=L9KSB3_TUPCH|nr:40S ribosomal protein S23 [Tupaia chinensis]